ncbi:uncharacterized protein [Rutidosis leptorrhynchoides]|uniref:uncharacterized protein n=1 Tax=Rutidosis leptorrhynchoides TaxID=125765 RepID=UPI003A995E83
MCEVLNRWLCDARDKPIITALEYVREYLMKRISNVVNVASKSDGPLTPKATKLFNEIMKDAHKCTVMWNGGHKYQVNGSKSDDQVVVDLKDRSCSCRKWELTGMPCRHAVAAIWDMGRHSGNVGFIESWVHPVYRLDTWKYAYGFSINPVNGRSLWPKSTVPNTLLPPKVVKTAGRPKKNRRKTMDEKKPNDNKGKLSRKGKTVKCGTCGTYGHNKRGCPGDSNAAGTPKKKQKMSNEASTSGT